MPAEAMIERVARELWQCAHDDAGPHYGATADEGWICFADDARRVIAAMREPTVQMVDASVGALSLEGSWRAMIDAALGEG